MKLIFESLKKKLKYYVLTAFVLINFFIAGQSLTPGGESAEQSNWVASIFATIASWVIPVSPNLIAVSAISIQGPETIYIGEAGVMTATITPTNATDSTIVWSSSNPEIVEITSGGRLIPKALGLVTIQAQSSVIDVFAEHPLSVIPLPLVSSFEASLTNSVIAIGSSETIVLSNVLPEKSDRSNIVFASEDTQIAQVSQQGVITGMSEGTTQISVGFLDTILFNFDVSIITSSNIIPTAMTITNANGETGPFESYIYSSYPLAIDWEDVIPTNTEITWTSSDENIARVNQDGLVYGFKFEGEAQITAQSQSNPNLIQVVTIAMVKARPLALTLTPNNNVVEVSAGSRLRINYTLTPLIEGTVVYDQQLVWSSSNNDVAHISSSGDYGTLVAISEGTITITASSVMDEDVQATLNIRILKPNLFTDQEYTEFATFFRKAIGHFLLFGVNGTLGYWTFYLFLNPKKQPWYVGVSLGLGLFMSITSEMLQAITPQRTSTVLDMILNFTGYFMATFLLWTFVFIYFQYLRPLHTIEQRNRIKK
jgi:uncharacterized protein YjdB/VanZ family protein